MSLSQRTKVNWLLDANVFLTALVATLTGIYFLYFPIGGYQGGRNPTYGLTVFVERATWDDWHTWSGIFMIIVGMIHLIYHWTWVTMMAKRLVNWMVGRPVKLSIGARINVLVNAMIGLGFILSAISGVYFLFQPRGIAALSELDRAGPFLFASNTWDVIHTWSSIIMILAAMAHFIIHWGWIEKVTRGFFKFQPKDSKPIKV